ncbi:histone acetyltransferase HAC5-like isoform X2 [Apium graveolens]|uniref:histone acetyltransferase HAC5-like isoform X2 n=1 Tax=Apium graveolens TaxID=4045 RepID=UPI003D7A444E
MDQRQCSLGQFSIPIQQQQLVFDQGQWTNDMVVHGRQQVYSNVDASEEEYRNLECLPPGRLKNLLLQEILATEPPQHWASSSWGNPPSSFYFNRPCHRVEYQQAASNEFQNFTPGLRDSVVSEGSLYKGYSWGVACSNRDKLSEIQQFKDGSYFGMSTSQQISNPLPENHINLQSIDRGVLKNHRNLTHISSIPREEASSSVLKMAVPLFSRNTSEACNDFSRVPFMQVDENLHSQSHMFSVTQDESFKQSSEGHTYNLSALPQQLSAIQQCHSGAAVRDLGLLNAAKRTNSSSSDWQTILLSYIKYKSTLGDQINHVPFLKHIHMTKCSSHQCNCYQYSVLISHYDNCLYSGCSTCAPVCNFFAAGKLYMEPGKRKEHFSGASYNREGNDTCSDTIGDCLPPLKRHKMEIPSMDLVTPAVNQPCPPDRVLHVEQFHEAGFCSRKNVIEIVLSPTEDQTGYISNKCHAIDYARSGDVCNISQPEQTPDQLPHLEQWGEAVLYNNDVTKVSKDELNLEGQTTESVNICDGTDSLPGDLPSIFSLLEKLISRSDYGDMDDTCSSEITNDTLDSFQGLIYNGLPDSSEVSTKENEKEDTEIGYLSRPVLEDKSSLLVSAADCKDVMKLKQLKMQGVSWTYYFSIEEMKEHLLSLRCMSQDMGDNMKSCYGENICQLCARDSLQFAPAQLYCSSCGILIKRNLVFYRASGETGVQHCFCTTCHRNSGGGIISFLGGQILKNKLQKEKNNEKIEESWVQCDTCERWQHQICALYNDKSDPGGKAEYVCPKCWLEEVKTGKREPLLRTVGFRAKDLPSTMLSEHIEKRLFNRLKEEREEWARISKKGLNEVPGEADLTVRVVLSVDKMLEVKQQYLDIIKGSDYPSQFLYRSKVILLFQRLEGVDVCLFAMYVQEYGSECGKPNQRCMYISYLDSVKYLRPEQSTTSGEALRTLVYHEILIGYLDYCKKRGFSTCYIWACPPLKGEDFILNCHPEYQKTPTVDKLRNWYGSMLKRAVEEGVVVDHKKFYDFFFLNSEVTLSQLPYFDGDYWSNAAGTIIKDFEEQSVGGSQRKVKKQVTKRTLKAMGHSTLSSDETKALLVMQKLGHEILPAKDDFLVVHLQFFCKCCHDVILSGVRWVCNQCTNFHICSRCLDAKHNHREEKTHTSNNGEKHVLCKVVMDDVPSDTKDNDIIIDHNVFSDRHVFLNFCQSNHYQFDTLRRAKHSSLMILYYLHNSLYPMWGCM